MRGAGQSAQRAWPSAHALRVQELSQAPRRRRRRGWGAPCAALHAMHALHPHPPSQVVV